MENGIVNVANRLPVSKYRISICALDSVETFSERIVRSDSEYFTLPKRGNEIDWGLAWRLARVLRRAKADLVHSHNWGTFLYAVLAANLARVPVIHGEHGKNEGELFRESGPKRWTKKLLGSRIDRLVTVSQTLADEWAGYGIPESNIQWIPNGVDTSRFYPRTDKAECRRMLGLPEIGFFIGSIGRLDSLKNYKVLIAAFAKLAQTSDGLFLVLVGRGPNEQDLREAAANSGAANRIFFLGHRKDPEVLLAALDVFALPSRFEGMSNVVLEAMASGLPVVCADLPCHHEVLEPGFEGLLVSPCTPEMLAEALNELQKSPERSLSMGAAARRKILAKFSIERMVADYDQLYSHFRRGKEQTCQGVEELPGQV